MKTYLNKNSRNLYSHFILLLCLISGTGPCILAQSEKSPAQDTLKQIKWGWSQEDRKKNLYICVVEAAKYTHEIKARAYCACVLEKVEMKFPDINDYEKFAAQGQKAMVEYFQNDFKKCSAMYIKNSDDVIADTIHWTKANEEIFKNTCTENLKKDAQGKLNAEKFCECYLDKVKYRFPNYADYMKLSFDPVKVQEMLINENTICIEEAGK